MLGRQLGLADLAVRIPLFEFQQQVPGQWFADDAQAQDVLQFFCIFVYRLLGFPDPVKSLLRIFEVDLAEFVQGDVSSDPVEQGNAHFLL